jgi:serine O-acetyltransferase
MILGEIERALANGLRTANLSNFADAPDWLREKKRRFEWAPSRSLLGTIRSYQRHASANRPWSGLLCRLAVVRFRFWSAVTGADIPLNCRISGGLLLPHPNGVVIHPAADIGPNCLVFQQVTIGMRHGGVPRIEGHVDIGAGAKVLGPITIGRNAKIGANAVVLTDVPAGATAVGSPARILQRARPDNFASLFVDSCFTAH